MSRPLRIEFDGAFYHIISRGQRKENIFYDDKDRNTFIEKICEGIYKHKIIIHAFVLMNNHYHMLMETPHGNLKRVMHHINTNYSNWFKAKYKIIGSIFQGRYKSILVEKDNYLLTLSAYVHLNPLRARIVDDLNSYKWSSYLYYIEKRPRPDWLYARDILSNFSYRGDRYSQFVMNCYKKKDNNSEINFYGKNSFLGSKSYLRDVMKRAKEKSSKMDDREIPDLKSIKLLSPGDIKRLMLDEFRIKERELFLKRRNAGEFRKLYIYGLKNYSPLKLKEIGDLMGLDYSAISRLCIKFAESLTKNQHHKKLFTRLKRRINNYLK